MPTKNLPVSPVRRKLVLAAAGGLVAVLMASQPSAAQTVRSQPNALGGYDYNVPGKGYMGGDKTIRSQPNALGGYDYSIPGEGYMGGEKTVHCYRNALGGQDCSPY